MIRGLSQIVSVNLISELKCLPPDFSFSDLSGFPKTIWPFQVLIKLLSGPRRTVAFVPACTGHIGILSSAILLWIFRVPIVIHGQAFLKKPSPRLSDNLVALFWLTVSTRYISYSDIGVDGLFAHPRLRHKVFTVLNRFESLSVLGLSDYQPNYASFKGASNCLKILFIGRNREGVRFDLAIALIKRLRQCGYRVELDVIGFHAEPHDGIIFHGPLPSKACLAVAKDSHIGLYPGDAGLSILHYMALGLCPVVHSDMRKHSGPEPAYVENNSTGCLFERLSLDSLLRVVIGLYGNPLLLAKLRYNARQKALRIHAQLYSREIFNLIAPLLER